MIELFTHFFELFKGDLLGMVEELRTTGFIHHHITSTYIALIPKHNSSKCFSGYKLISLCNLIYKIISTTIVNRMHNTLSRYITPEQRGFLQDRLIHDTVANA